MEFLNLVYLGNPLWKWATAVVLILGVMISMWALRAIAVNRLRIYAKRTQTDIDDLVVDLLRRTRYLVLLLLAVFLGATVLTLPDKATGIIKVIAIIALLVQVAIWGSGLISYLVTRYAREKIDVDAAAATTISAFGFIGKLVLWSIILLLSLDNLGIDINALIAGLGIGGIAVALAAQNILGDLFGSISIILDKPFVIGDFIIVDDLLGTVEHIGLKTTRVRSLFGEQLVFSNNDLLGSRIRNFKRMFERRIAFSLGVIYQTPYEKLARIPRIIQEIIDSLENTRFDRAHFKAYGDFSLNFEIVYYVLVPDYNTYMDIQQSINLAIFKRFEEEGIEFAYPTQTLFVEREGDVKTNSV